MTTLQGVIVTPCGTSTDRGQADSAQRPALSPVAPSAHRPGAALARLGEIGGTSRAAKRFGVSGGVPPAGSAARIDARMPVSVVVMPAIVDRVIDGMEGARQDREAQDCDSKMEDVVRAQQDMADMQLKMEELRALQRMEEAKASVVKAAGEMIRDAARPH